MNYQGSCHCGKVKFKINLSQPINEALACNCSICGRKGTLLAFVPGSQLELISGADSLTDYQFGKKNIHHTFCSTCEVTAFSSGNAPDGSLMRAVNVRCLDDLDIDKIKINHYDGKSL